MIARKNGKSSTDLLKLMNAVQCKDCTNWSDRFKKLEFGKIKMKWCIANEMMTLPEFYCAWGERKEE